MPEQHDYLEQRSMHRRSLRRILTCRAATIWLCACAAVSGVADAMTRIDVYQTIVPVAGRSEAAQAAAFDNALRIVLERATGRRTAGEEPVFAPLTANARRFVQQYRSTADGKLMVAFDGTAIERWLIQHGEPVWGRDRPSTYVWVTVQTGPQSVSVLTTEDTSDLKNSIDEAAAARGLPLVWPSADSASAAPSATIATVADAARRMGAEGVLFGRAPSSAGDAPVRWTFIYADHSSEMSGASEGVNRAADAYAGLFAASGNLAPVEIEVSGLNDVRDYAGIQSYLEALSFVTHVEVDALHADSARFRLTMRGGIEPLQRAFALGGRLMPLPAGDGGVQRFEFHR